MTSKEKYVAPTWNQTYKMLLDLAEQMNDDGFKPDIIVGVARGGMIPARVLSDLLENPNLTTVRTECYGDVEDVKTEPALTQQISTCVKGKKVLIVDDVADTGRSLKLVKDHLIENDAQEIKVATLYRKPWSSLKPDYCEKETLQWVVFPWDIKETVRQEFVNLKNTSTSQLSLRLRDAGLPEKLVDRFLKDMAGEKSC